MSELKVVLEDPSIKRFVEIIEKNKVLVDVINDFQLITQAFPDAETLIQAFNGQLPKMPDMVVDAQMESAKRKHGGLMKKHGIDDCDVRALFEKVWIYARLAVPTNELLEESISVLEQTEKTAVFSSGLAAIRAAINQFTAPARKGENGEYVMGDKVVVIGSVYGGTFAQFENLIGGQGGREVCYMSIDDFNEKGFDRDVSMVYFEACNNPTLEVVPISKVVEEAKRVGAKTVCDNTFAPISICPAELGVDLVVHSMTKYFNGRSEDIGGSVSGSADLISQFSDLHKGERMVGGAIMAPRVAGEFVKNISDLVERLYYSTQNARAIKKIANKCGFNVRTIEDYKEYSENRRSSLHESIASGMIALYLDSLDQAKVFVDAMIGEEAGIGAVSLGSINTLYSIPSATTHSEMPQEEQERVGITPGLVRISCGIEDDLVDKFEKVLEKMLEKGD